MYSVKNGEPAKAFQTHREEVVLEPLKRDLLCAHGPAGLIVALEDGRAPSRLGKQNRCYEAIVASSDHDRVRS